MAGLASAIKGIDKGLVAKSKEQVAAETEKGSTTGLPGAIAGLYKTLLPEFEKGEAAREERYGAGIGDLSKVLELFGGGYGAGMEKTALTGMEQGMVGRGLGGTTRPAAIGAGMKAGFEDVRRGKMAEALTRMAEYRRMFPETTATAGVMTGLTTGGYGALSVQQKQAMAELQKPKEKSMFESLAGSFLGGLGGSFGGGLGAAAAGGVSNWFSGGGGGGGGGGGSMYGPGAGAATYGISGGYG